MHKNKCEVHSKKLSKCLMIRQWFVCKGNIYVNDNRQMRIEFIEDGDGRVPPPPADKRPVRRVWGTLRAARRAAAAAGRWRWCGRCRSRRDWIESLNPRMRSRRYCGAGASVAAARRIEQPSIAWDCLESAVRQLRRRSERHSLRRDALSLGRVEHLSHAL